MKIDGYVKKSTFILTIISLIIIFAICIFAIISNYEKNNVQINIPTVVEEDNINSVRNNITIK